MAEGTEERKSSEDSVKLFVGQVPKHMTEAELLAMFKEFALVDEVNIIKEAYNDYPLSFLRNSKIQCVENFIRNVIAKVF